jgi:hypothetical protein
VLAASCSVVTHPDTTTAVDIVTRNANAFMHTSP